MSAYTRLLEVSAKLLQLQAIRDEHVPFLCLQNGEGLKNALLELSTVRTSYGC